MIKKIIPYVLILIILAGLFNPMSIVSAADLGTCSNIPIKPTPKTGPTTKTETDTSNGWCDAVGGKWTKNIPDQPLPPIQGGPGGTCRLTITTGTTVEIIRSSKGECEVKTNYQSWIEETLAKTNAAIAANILKEPLGNCSSGGRDLGVKTERECVGGCLIEIACLYSWKRITTGDLGPSGGGNTPPTTCLSPQVLKDGKCVAPDTNYTFLAPLPGLGDTFNPTQANNLGAYLNIMINLFIGICAVLAVIMIVVGGIEYMTSELPGNKDHGKERIRGAIFGLILALGAWTLLNTINPDLLKTDLTSLKEVVVTITISREDTSTGSSTSVCLPSNPPNPDSATGSTVNLNSAIVGKYIPARDALSLPTGIKLLITAQTHMEGFFDGSKSYRTNNPGNIGNTDDGQTKTYPTLTDGIKAQQNIASNVASGTAKSYKIGGSAPCALGNEKYDGSLYQYLRIYATGARTSNTYLNVIISYFKQNGKTITARTKMSEIASMQ